MRIAALASPLALFLLRGDRSSSGQLEHITGAERLIIDTGGALIAPDSVWPGVTFDSARVYTRSTTWTAGLTFVRLGGSIGVFLLRA